MKKVVLLVLLPLVFFAAMRPKNVVAELSTATWCGYCPNAYAALEVMKGKYPIPDLACVRYYASSGDYGSAEIDARIDYYNVSGYPTCVFNGTESIVGAGSDAVDGHYYDPVISSLLMEGTPFGITVNMSVASGKATVTTTVKLYDNYAGTAPKLRVALTEDDVTSEYTDLTRRVVTAGDVAITNEGQEQVLVDTFDVDASWMTDKLHAVAFLQIDGTKEVLQSASTYPSADYHYRLTAPARITRLAPSGSFTSSFYLTNVGSKSDQFTVTLDRSKLPSGWSAQLAEPVIQGTVNLASGEGAEYQIEIKPNGNTGQGDVVVKFSSSGGDEDQEVSFRVITNDVDINLVDDDGGDEFEGYFAAALDAIGTTYGVWDVDMGDFRLNNLADDMSPVLIWSCGWAFPSLDPEQRNLLKFYLDSGGKLFITGQDIGWDLCDADSDNSTYDSKQFYNNYLHATYVSDDADNTDISGVAGDPITDGLSFAIAGGDGANNQDYPSIIRPYDDYATSIFTYSTGDTAAIRVEKDDYKIVYLAFGYEAIDNATDRRDLLENALDWLGTAPPIVGISEKPAQAASMLLHVNGISTGNLVAFYSMPAAGGRIDVYDALGRRVAGIKLLEREGRTELNVEHLPAGCYFVRLKAGEATHSSKIVLVR